MRSTRPARGSRATRAGLAVACLLLGACGPGSPEASGSGDGPGAEAGSGGGAGLPAAAGAGPRDPRLAAVVDALEHGRGETARTLLAALGRTTLDARLAQARAALSAGDAIGALRELEEARRIHGPVDRVQATLAEVYAATGEHEAAERELREGLRTAGRTAALERARAVCNLVRPGGAEVGLAALEEALALDPDLPYVGLPLQQARLLVGRKRLGEEDAVAARDLARAALDFDPASLDVRELLADALAALGEYAEALDLYAGLESDGRFLGERRAELHKRAGLQSILEGDRPAALDHFRAARELGLDDEALGHGADALAQAARRAIERGIDLYEEGDWEGALTAFRLARRDAPADLEARNHEAVCLFRLERFAASAGAFEGVLEAAARQEVELPEPVHLNAARAWRLAGEPGRARAVLEGYLVASPAGSWEAETREMLARLAAEVEDGLEKGLESGPEAGPGG